MRNKNRTIKGDQLRRKHQATYDKWWLGKYFIGHFNTTTCNPTKIIKVEYFGNSMCGSVLLTLEDGSQVCPHTPGYRPTKDSINVIDDI